MSTRHSGIGDTKRLKDVLKGLRLHNVKKVKAVNADVTATWERVVRDEVRCHARIADVRKGIVHVEVDSHVWLHHITSFCKKDILDAFQREVCSVFISDVKFRLQTN